jgi:hypothetical protein
MTKYAALSKTPHALADGLMLVFQHPAKANGARQSGFYRAAPARDRGLIPIKDCGVIEADWWFPAP